MIGMVSTTHIHDFAAEIKHLHGMRMDIVGMQRAIRRQHQRCTPVRKQAVHPFPAYDLRLEIESPPRNRRAGEEDIVPGNEQALHGIGCQRGHLPILERNPARGIFGRIPTAGFTSIERSPIARQRFG